MGKNKGGRSYGYKHITAERVRALKHLTIEQIAERLFCSTHTIKVVCRENAISIAKPSPLTPDDWPTIRTLLHDGMAITVLMQKYEVAYYTMKKFIDDHRTEDASYAVRSYL